MEDPRLLKTVAAFREGLSRELEAQKTDSRRAAHRLAFKGPLESRGGRYRASFTADSASEAMVTGASAKLLADDQEVDVRLDQVDGVELVLSCSNDLLKGDCQLSLTPWFLFDRLADQLSWLEKQASAQQVQAGLQAFGVLPAEVTTEDPWPGDEELNEEQSRAVNLALTCSATRIWGPPGTGKTKTLSVLVAELVSRGERALLTSNTHAALDQVLLGLLRRPALQSLAHQGLLLRLGPCLPEHRDCDIREVTQRMNDRLRQRKEKAEIRSRQLAERMALLRDRLHHLRSAAGPQQQLSLFEQGEPEGLPQEWLSAHFGQARGARWAQLSLPSQCGLLERHYQRLSYLHKRYNNRVADCREAMVEQQRQTLGRARVVLSTLANLTTSQLTDGETFDNVIVEEAGMALLPALFMACTRARKRTVAVGDPRQLPSILISRDSYVHRTLGRNIFEVGQVPKAMLTVQYRMHPEIGDLVSHLAYDDLLGHGRAEEHFAPWTEREPLQGVALAGWDLRGASNCQKAPRGNSRFNAESAQICLKLAGKAVSAGFTEIAIITPYREQVRKIREQLPPELSEIVECDTVHRYQGKERDLVIVDLVDGESLGPGTLLRAGNSTAQLLNVAFSRARYKLFLVGELAYLCRQAPESFVGRAILYLARRKRLIKVVRA